ncbi:MAG: circadian clock KaiB family protein [Myxococcota bacterium]|nr:circadian clock KaiB family protein [Myxococcota bacterium]
MRTKSSPTVKPRGKRPVTAKRAATPRVARPRPARVGTPTRARKPALAKAPPVMLLRLYIAGTSLRSTRAIQNARKLCDEHLAGRYQLEVIDIFQQPALAKDHQILAVPTLIRALPMPLRRFIGDLSEQEVVLFGLDLKQK